MQRIRFLYSVKYLGQKFIFLLFASLLISCGSLRMASRLLDGCTMKTQEQLLGVEIPAQFFPPNAKINLLHPDRERLGARCAAVTTHYWDSNEGTAIFSLRQFYSGTDASSFLKSAPLPKLYNKPVQQSIFVNADDFSIGCGNSVTGDYRCTYESIYSSYYVFFSVSVGENDVSEEKFAEIVQWLDKKLILLSQSTD